MNNPDVDFRTSIAFSRLLKEMPSYLLLAASTLLFNMLRTALKPFFKGSKLHKNGLSPEMVIIGFGGIGNHLMLIPAIQTIHRFLPETRIHVMATSRPSAELLREVAAVDSVSIYKTQRSEGRLKHLNEMIREIKLLQPDIIMGAAGIDPVFLSIASFFSGACRRIGADWRGRGFLLTQAVPLNGNEYEAVQNMRIAALLIDQPLSETIASQTLMLKEEALQLGRLWRDSLNIGEETAIVGIHPGSGIEQKWKRWKLEKFAETRRRLEQAYSCNCVFFLGPDEEELEKGLIGIDIPPKYILREANSILMTASRIVQCRLFIANDSGLRQLAVSLGVPSIGIFGPTGTDKNFISIGLHEAITAEHVLCRPCHYTRWWLACQGNQRCLEDITVDAVISMAGRHLKNMMRKEI